jgi:hypothetical protein
MNDEHLTRPELRWLERHLDLPSGEYVSRFFRYRARLKGRAQPRTTWRALLEHFLTDTNESVEIDLSGDEKENAWSYLDRNLEMRLLQVPPADFKGFCEAGRDLVRGYTDEELDLTVKVVSKEKAKLLERISLARKQNARALARANRRRRSSTQNALTRNGTELEELENDTRKCIPTLVARHRLARRESGRRMPSLRFIYDLQEPLYNLRMRLSLSIPAQFEMPTRFLGSIPYPTYHTLTLRAEKGATRDELLDVLVEKENVPRMIESIESLDRKLVDLGMPDRSFATAELLAAWKVGLYHSVALIAVTHTEGRLWDLAEYLNRCGIRIYRTERSRPNEHKPFLWEAITGKYKRDGGKMVVARKRLTSGKELLRQTRLGSLVNEGLYSFLVEEHTDYRNPLLHGRVARVTSRYDTMLSLLCCRETLLETGRIAVERKAF